MSLLLKLLHYIYNKVFIVSEFATSFVASYLALLFVRFCTLKQSLIPIMGKEKQERFYKVG